MCYPLLSHSEREKRRRKHEKRRLKRLRQQEQGGSSLAGSGTTGIPSGSESDSESEEDSEVDSAELAAATAAADETDATTGAAGLPPRPPKRKSKSKKAKWQQQGSAAAGGSGLSLSGSDSDVSSGDGRQQHREASTIGRQLPKILIEVVPADAAEAAIAGAAAGQDGGSDGWDSDGGGRKTRSSLQGEAVVNSNAAGTVSARETLQPFGPHLCICMHILLCRCPPHFPIKPSQHSQQLFCCCLLQPSEAAWPVS